jgi:hypothetical protein
LRIILILPAVLGLASMFSSCSQSVASLPWTSLEGRKLVFFQTENFPKGEEGILTGTRTRASYRLKEPLPLPSGSMIAVGVNVLEDDLVLSFSLQATDKIGKAAAAPELRTLSRFAAKKGRAVFYLDPPARGTVAALVVETALPSLPAGGAAGKDIPCANVEYIAASAAFRGYERREKDFRISAGVSFTGGGEGMSRWSISGPFEDMTDKAVLTIRPASPLAKELSIEAGRKIRVRPTGSGRELSIPASAFLVAGDAGNRGSLESIGLLSAEIASSTGLDSMFIEAPSDAKAEEGLARRFDPGILLLGSPLGVQEDFAWIRWDILPEVVIMDFRDYATQDAYLKRLAFFVEKKGFAGSLAQDHEIADLHGWNAHDYRARDLARFFNEAAHAKFPLNEKELALRQFLIDRKILGKKGSGFEAGEGVLLSISRESASYLRHSLLTHESSHAIFFVDDEYRAFSTGLYASMDRAERWFWILFFGWMHYDTSSPELMANEMQAYLLQQPLKSAGKYFTSTLVGRMLETNPELEESLEAYMEQHGEEFEKKAARLDAWLARKYGFGAGSSFFIR